MDNLLSSFLSWQFALFAMAVVAVVYSIRKIVEYIFSSNRMSTPMLWSELILPLLPVILGALFGYFISMYPYPEGLTSAGSRVLFGLVAGFSSSTVYKILKGLLKEKAPDIANKLPENIIPPA